jgi:hypothetical protein
MPNIADFGNVIVLTTKDMRIVLKNIGNTKITLNTLLPLVNYPANDIFKITPKQIGVPIILNKGDTVSFNVTFAPVDVKEYTDTLKISITTSTCPDEKQIILRGNGVPGKLASVWLPKVLVLPTLDDYHLPIYVRFDKKGDELTGASFKAEISFDPALFYPKGVSNNGQILSNKVVNGRGVIQIASSGIKISDSDSVLAEVIGSTLLGDKDTSSVKWESFEWTMGNQVAPPTLQDGKLDIIICREGQNRLIKSGAPAIMMVKENPSGNAIDIHAEVLEVGEYWLELVDMQGMTRKLTNWNVTHEGTKIFDIAIPTDNISNGSYYLILKSPARVQAMQLFIVK